MNTKLRIFELFKTLSCRSICNTSSKGIAKCCRAGYLIIQRGKTTKHNLFEPHLQSVRRPNLRTDVPSKDDIGSFGFFLLGMPVAAFCLGTWQVQRHKWKIALIDDLKKRVNSSPVDLPEDLSQLETMEYHPVTVRGRFLHDTEIVAGPKSLILKGAGASEGAGGVLTPGKTNTGYCIITPFKLEDRDLTILVNRGWVPITYKKDHKQAAKNSNEIVEVTGVVRLNEKRPVFMPKNSPSTGGWLYRDLDAMSKVAGTAPVYIELVDSESIKGGPKAGQTRITLRNEHMSYIFTWYALSIITGWMWHRRFIRKLPLM